ncbi:MAG: 2,3-dihydroxybiphenyl 1,2-dioxygenase [Pseudomonadota bacterium]
MTVRALGYLDIGVSDVATWRRFSADILGASVSDRGDDLLLRFDSRQWRIAIEPSGTDDIAYAGWKVAGSAELAATIARIEASGVKVKRDDGTLATKALDETLVFYRNILGFGYSDYVDMPAGPGQTIPVQFMHCNARHQTFAFASPPPVPDTPKLIHFMVQVASVDDVGFAFDRVEKAGVEVAMTLGRHGQ